MIDCFIEYFEDCYYASSDSAKEDSACKFLNDFWDGFPELSIYNTKYGKKISMPKVKDAPYDFICKYINMLYAKYCKDDLWKNHSKFSYTRKHFKTIVNLYLKNIIKNYKPESEYLGEDYEYETRLGTGYGMEDAVVCKYITKSLSGYFKSRMKNYLSGKYIECKCGRMVLKKSNRQSMCEDCRVEKEAEDSRRYARESMMRHRNNVKGLET